MLFDSQRENTRPTQMDQLYLAPIRPSTISKCHTEKQAIQSLDMKLFNRETCPHDVILNLSKKLPTNSKPYHMRSAQKFGLKNNYEAEKYI